MNSQKVDQTTKLLDIEIKQEKHESKNSFFMFQSVMALLIV